MANVTKRTLDKRRPLRVPGSAEFTESIMVSHGVLGLYRIDANGRLIIVGLYFPGEIVWPGARGGSGLWPLTHRAEVMIAETSAPSAFSLTQGDVNAQIRRDLAIAHEWLSVSRAAAAERLAHLFCEMAVRCGDTDLPPLTQAVLGDLSGQTSINVCRIISTLTEEGLIEFGRGKMRILDLDGMKARAHFDGAYLESGNA